VKNFPGTGLEARRLGRHVVNSPLFKCAVSGELFQGIYISSRSFDKPIIMHFIINTQGMILILDVLLLQWAHGLENLKAQRV
jgi:hypothetical protein